MLDQRNKILLKISHAENFTPHKIDYYKNMLFEFDMKNINFWKYESLKVRIYWKGILQPGVFNSVNSALNNINTISGGYNKFYQIRTPESIINLQ